MPRGHQPQGGMGEMASAPGTPASGGNGGDGQCPRNTNPRQRGQILPVRPKGHLSPPRVGHRQGWGRSEEASRRKTSADRPLGWNMAGGLSPFLFLITRPRRPQRCSLETVGWLGPSTGPLKHQCCIYCQSRACTSVTFKKKHVNIPTVRLDTIFWRYYILGWTGAPRSMH